MGRRPRIDLAGFNMVISKKVLFTINFTHYTNADELNDCFSNTFQNLVQLFQKYFCIFLL